jgi:hypothetical protein
MYMYILHTCYSYGLLAPKHQEAASLVSGSAAPLLPDHTTGEDSIWRILKRIESHGGGVEEDAGGGLNNKEQIVITNNRVI